MMPYWQQIILGAVIGLGIVILGELVIYLAMDLWKSRPK